MFYFATPFLTFLERERERERERDNEGTIKTSRRAFNDIYLSMTYSKGGWVRQAFPRFSLLAASYLFAFEGIFSSFKKNEKKN